MAGPRGVTRPARTLGLAIAALLIALGAPHAQQEERGHPRAGAPVTILQLNDVYSTVPVDGLGGLARVATLKSQLAAAGRTPLLVLAGDFLSSSVASTVFKGEQMIAALNAAGLDVATLGNHEFDFGLDVLLQRMGEARFSWVVSNVIDAQTGQPVGGAAPYLVRRVGGITVGILGLCLDPTGMPRDRLERIRIQDPLEAAAAYLPRLKQDGAEVIVALTHLTFADDRALALRFPEIDVIVGGHEHFPIAAVEGRTLISKAGTDAKYVARIDLDRPRDGPTSRFYELVPITSALSDDPGTAAVVQAYEAKLDGALDEVIARTAAPLDGTAARLRTRETNLGNLVADAVREAADAEVAIVNSGGIRGDRVHAAGPITRRQLVEIHPFGNHVVKLAVPGRVIVEALNHGVSSLPASSGPFPQVSNLRFRVDPRAPPGARVSDVAVGGGALDPGRTYTLAIPDFIYQGGDGYTMFAGQTLLIEPDLGPQVVDALERHVAGRAVAPAIEERIVIR